MVNQPAIRPITTGDDPPSSPTGTGAVNDHTPHTQHEERSQARARLGVSAAVVAIMVARLATTGSEATGDLGKAILIDCHSMPANVRVAGGNRRPDIIIGDRYGASAAHDLSRAAVSILSGLGYNVVRNKPYAGGFITEHYGRPGRGLHALQIEINRGLYVNETTLEKTRGFDLLKNDLTEFAGQMMAHVRVDMSEDRLAAE